MVREHSQEKTHLETDIDNRLLIQVRNGSWKDNGAVFHKQLFKEFIAMFGTDDRRVVGYQKQGNPMGVLVQYGTKPLTVIERSFLEDLISVIINKEEKTFNLYLGMMPRRKEDVAMYDLRPKPITIDDKSYIPANTLKLFVHLLQVVGLEQTVMIITLLKQLNKRCMQ